LGVLVLLLCRDELLRLVLNDYPFGENPHFLSHFDGSCWQLSLHQSAGQGKNKPFEWLGRVISFNRIIQLYQKKAHSHANKHVRMFSLHMKDIFLNLNFYFMLLNCSKHTKTQCIFLNFAAIHTPSYHHLLKFIFLSPTEQCLVTFVVPLSSKYKKLMRHWSQTLKTMIHLAVQA